MELGTISHLLKITRVDFRAKSTQYRSAYPRVDIWIDSEYHSSVSIDSSSWKIYSTHGDWSKGTHTIYFDYVNDFGSRAVHLDYAVAAGEKKRNLALPSWRKSLQP